MKRPQAFIVTRYLYKVQGAIHVVCQMYHSCYVTLLAVFYISKVTTNEKVVLLLVWCFTAGIKCTTNSSARGNTQSALSSLQQGKALKNSTLVVIFDVQYQQ